MKRLIPFLVVSVFLIANPLSSEWKQIYEGQELNVFRKEIKGFDTFAFKAVGIIHSPLSKVASVLIDAERRKEWMPDVGDTWVLEELNQNERVEYVHIKTPFVIKDREFVLHSKASWNKENRTVTFTFDSTKNAAAPTTKRIRAELFESKYILKDLGDSTEVEFTVHVDPKGTVPKWLVNLFQKNYPRKTIEALREQSQKEDVIVADQVKRALISLAP